MEVFKKGLTPFLGSRILPLPLWEGKVFYGILAIFLYRYTVKVVK